MKGKPAGLLILALAIVAAPTVWSSTISVGTATAEIGASVGLPVQLSNYTHSISGLLVPLQYDKDRLHADSISFEGSFKPSDFEGYGYIADSSAGYLLITYLPQWLDPLPIFTATDGLIATVYFTVLDSPGPDTSVVDSVFKEFIITSGEGGVDTTVITLQAYILDYSIDSVFLPDFQAGAVVTPLSTGVDDGNEGSSLPSEFELAQNYPNPFNPQTTIGFSLPQASQVELAIFNILGQKVATLIDGRMEAGRHEANFDASDQPSGIYFYRLTHQAGTETRKMVLLK